MPGSHRLFRLGLWRRQTARAEMAEELEFHLQARVDRLVAKGMTPPAARAEAMRLLGGTLADAERQLGDSAELKERRLDVRDRWNDFIDDVRYAVRGLRRSPGFATVAILTLAIGIGANTAIYSAVDALLLRSLPYREPGRLVSIAQQFAANGTTQWSYPKYAFFRDAQRSYSSVAAYEPGQTTLTGPDPERVNVEQVTAQYLTTLGIAVPTGRDFPADIDAAPGARKLALISDALWQRRFAADPHVAGKTLELNNAPWEIVGVLPPGFRGLSGRADALVNLTARPADDLSQIWSLEFSMIGRLKPGIGVQAAQGEGDGFGPRLDAAFPPQAGTLSTSKTTDKWTVAISPLNNIRVAAGLRRSLLVLFGAVVMVLLIACANLANLLIARALARKQEIAVRLAIGARRGRLIRLLVTESVVLAMLGGIVGLGVALAGTRALSAINPRETLTAQGLSGGIGSVGFESIALDGRALVFAFCITLVVGVMFGLVPALRATRSDLSRDLRDGGSGAGFGRGIGISRRALVVAEIALALVLLAGSGLMIRSLGNLLSVNPGFDGNHVLTLRLSIPPGVLQPDSMPGFYDQLQTQIGALPGVQSVALQDCAPLSNACNGTIMTFADRPPQSGGNAMVGVHWVTPSWQATMRVPLKRGRFFSDADRLGTPKVVLINEEAARKYFPGQDPIGKRVAVYQGGFNTGAEVIGIVGDVRYGTIDSTARPDAYISYNQGRVARMMIFIRTSSDPLALAPAVRTLIRRIAPRDPMYDIRPMSQRVGTASAQARLSAVLLALFAAVSLSLAVIGIYGVMSFAVAQRTREIGIRVALGADRHRVLGLIMREGAVLAGAGIAIGLVAAFAFTRVLRSMLFEVGVTDLPTYGAIVVMAAAAVLAASWIPAQRAAAVDPVRALKN